MHLSSNFLPEGVPIFICLHDFDLSYLFCIFYFPPSPWFFKRAWNTLRCPLSTSPEPIGSSFSIVIPIVILRILRDRPPVRQNNFNFKSILVQGESVALKTIAAYIDLNPVRARMMHDPKDYRWCGYGEAMGTRAGSKAQEAVRYLVELTYREYGGKACALSSSAVLARWRRYMFGLPEDGATAKRHTERVKEQRKKVKNMEELPSGEIGQQKRVSPEKVLEVLENQGEVSLIEACGCKVRYFIDGAALGARQFVEEVFQANRGCFGAMRTEGARALKGIKQGTTKELYGLRDLRKEVFMVNSPPE